MIKKAICRHLSRSFVWPNGFIREQSTWKQTLQTAKRSVRVAVAGGAALLSSATTTLAFEGDAQTPTVIELYTSQGCSSCPPADKLLQELAQKPNILALSFHVDYWDYIGWKDPLALPLSAKRQRAYAEKLQLRYVYTPQIVVDGSVEAVGSQRREIKHCMNVAQEKTKIRLEQKSAKTVALPKSMLLQPLDIWQVAFKKQTKTRVLRGENTGRDLTHVNSVRALKHLGKWDGAARTLEIADMKTKEPTHDGVALLIQEPNSGPIRAALIVQ